ncbi:MAG TPA: lyase family protein, partial [Chloroflexota bacterium]
MIPRYTHPEMGRVWSEENKLQKWLLVEVLVCEAWARLGVVPQEALDEIRRASVDRERMAAIEAETHHDVISFVRSLAEQVGDAGRFIHLGLTSSDVLDTALAVQLLEAADILLADLARLEEVLARQAVRHKDTLMIGRTHGIHAEPTTFGFKLAGWVAETRRNRRRLQQARETVAVGKIGGAV